MEVANWSRFLTNCHRVRARERERTTSVIVCEAEEMGAGTISSKDWATFHSREIARNN